jgi:hypothetical protein
MLFPGGENTQILNSLLTRDTNSNKQLLTKWLTSATIYIKFRTIKFLLTIFYIALLLSLAR